MLLQPLRLRIFTTMEQCVLVQLQEALKQQDTPGVGFGLLRGGTALFNPPAGGFVNVKM